MNSRVMYDLIIMLPSYLNKINFTLTRLLHSLNSDLYTYLKNHAIIGSQRMTTGEFVITLLASFLTYSPTHHLNVVPQPVKITAPINGQNMKISLVSFCFLGCSRCMRYLFS